MCVRYRELPNTQRFEAWFFSLSINIQCERFASLGVVSILSLSFSSAFFTIARHLRVSVSDLALVSLSLCLLHSHSHFFASSFSRTHSFWQLIFASDKIFAILTNICWENTGLVHRKIICLRPPRLETKNSANLGKWYRQELFRFSLNMRQLNPEETIRGGMRRTRRIRIAITLLARFR